MPRPERDLSPLDGPVQGFAAALRALRRDAGNPVYRELAERTGYSTTTLSDAAGGRRLPALPVVLAYAEACGGDPEEWRDRWEALARELAADGDDETPPYLGLSSYQVEDGGRFFGRDNLVEELLRRLVRGRFLAVFGASGSGKSSILRAGVVARIHRDGLAGRPLRPLILTPGATPSAELDRQLAVGLAGDTDALIVVDQFEELFTLCADAEDGRRFVGRLIELANDPDRQTRVVLGIRADFYAACAQFPSLVAAMSERSVLVGPMGDDELRLVVTKPAALAGLTVERALVTKILADTRSQPGALPMVSHALLETWRQRQGATLTLGGYEAAGGVRGAIARTAERVYGQLDPEQQSVARQIFLRMTALGQGTEDTRRLVGRAELDLDGAGPIVDALVASRLVVAQDDQVEVAHEALIRVWPRLRTWLTEDREAIRTHRQIIESAALWQSLDRDPSVLFRGTRLAIAREWADGAGRRSELNPVESAFLDASTAVEQDESAAAGRSARQLRVLTVALAGFLVVALAAGATAAFQWRTVAQQREEAVSRQFASQAVSMAGRDVPGAMRLAAEAYQMAPTVEARGALLSLASRQVYTGRLKHAGMVKDLVFSADGATLATAGEDGRVAVWDVATRRQRMVLTGHDSAVRTLAMSPDQRWLVSGALNGSVIMWDLAKGTELRRLRAKGALIDSVAISPDGKTIAALGLDRRTMLWRSSDGTSLGDLPGHGGKFAEADFSPDGKQVATAGDDGRVVIWDLANRRRVRELRVSSTPLATVQFSPDGRAVAAAGDDRDITLWDPVSGAHLKTLVGHTSMVRCLTFAADGATLVSAGAEGIARVWDVKVGRETAALTGNSGNLYGVAVSPDGRTIAGGSRDRTALLWDSGRMPMAGHTHEARAVTATATSVAVAAAEESSVVLWDPATKTKRAVFDDRSPAALAARDSTIGDLRFSRDGSLVAAASFDNKVRVWDTRSGRLTHTLAGHTESLLAVTFDPSGRYLVSGGADKTVRVWNPLTGASLAVLRPKGAVRSLAFSADGRRLMAATYNGHVTVWAAPDWTVKATLTEGDGLISADISPDAKLVAVGRANGTVALWDVARARIAIEMPSHSASVNSIAFSPDGRLLASGGLDGPIRLLDVANRTHWATLSGSDLSTNDLAWAPNSRVLYSAGGDQRVTSWTIDTQEAMRGICAGLAHEFPGHRRPDCAASATAAN